jgi:hypothetical protein
LGYGNGNNIGDGANEMGDNLAAIDLSAPWTTCVAGEKVTVDGTATSDRQCGACAAKTFTSAPNQQSCAPWTTCAAGEKVTVDGTAASDRQCGACAAETFTSATNQQSCTPLTTCVAGEKVTVNGTAASDRQCGACPTKTFTSATNQQSCTPWTTCVAGEKMTVNGAATTDRQCAALTCDGSAITEANAARTGGDATGGPTGAASNAEAFATTIIFTCDHSAGSGAAAATTQFTCGALGTFVEDSAVTCPVASPADAAANGGDATATDGGGATADAAAPSPADAATSAGSSPMIIVLGICGVITALAALYIYFHNKKHSAAASVANKSDLEQPKMGVELTANPMKQNKL